MLRPSGAASSRDQALAITTVALAGMSTQGDKVLDTPLTPHRGKMPLPRAPSGTAHRTPLPGRNAPPRWSGFQPRLGARNSTVVQVGLPSLWQPDSPADGGLTVRASTHPLLYSPYVNDPLPHARRLADLVAWTPVPRLAIKIVSEGNWRKDYRDAPAKYAQLGCGELIIRTGWDPTQRPWKAERQPSTPPPSEDFPDLALAAPNQLGFTTTAGDAAATVSTQSLPRAV